MYASWARCLVLKEFGQFICGRVGDVMQWLYSSGSFIPFLSLRVAPYCKK